MFGSYGGAIAATSLTFVSQAAMAAGIPEQIDITTPAVPVAHCRNLSKADMKLNTYAPHMEVNSETY
jgi:urease subunit alpha